MPTDGRGGLILPGEIVEAVAVGVKSPRLIGQMRVLAGVVAEPVVDGVRGGAAQVDVDPLTVEDVPGAGKEVAQAIAVEIAVI